MWKQQYVLGPVSAHGKIVKQRSLTLEIDLPLAIQEPHLTKPFSVWKNRIWHGQSHLKCESLNVLITLEEFAF